MKRLIERKAPEEPEAAARIVTDYKNAVDALKNEEKLIYIEGNAYATLMEMVNADASLSKWMKSLGKFYAGSNGLHMLFSTLAATQHTGSESPSPSAERTNFCRFVRKFTENEYLNYKGRNNKNKDRFELLRIK